MLSFDRKLQTAVATELYVPVRRRYEDAMSERNSTLAAATARCDALDRELAAALEARSDVERNAAARLAEAEAARRSLALQLQKVGARLPALLLRTVCIRQ